MSDAKRHFSKNACPAFRVGGRLLAGSAIRQDYLAEALRWMVRREGLSCTEQYMAAHQHDANANELWIYFRTVIDWVRLTFTHYRKEMKGIDWGELYEHHGRSVLSATELEEQITRLMADSDVTQKRGIYAYVLGGDERALSIRAFDNNMKREAYERQNGKCAICGRTFDMAYMQGDHIKPWSRGGRTIGANCQMLCRECNSRKSNH